MKKILTIAASLLLTLTANAENRKWDFANWSPATISNLAADCATNSGEGTLWCDIEKASGSSRNPTSGGCYWLLKAAASAQVTVDGTAQPIKELEGLDFSGVGDRALAMAVNYAKTSRGEYHGAAYLWMGSKKKYFTVKSVAPGALIKMGIESHMPTDPRGVSLTVGSQVLQDKNGSTSSTPTTYTDYEWTVPSAEDLTAAGVTIGEDGTVDLKVTNTNGCHIYYLYIFDNGIDVENPKQIGYIYNSTAEGYSEADDAVLGQIGNGGTGYLTTKVDVSRTGVTLDSLYAFDAIVVSPYLSASDEFATTTLKSAIAFEPMINLNPDLYAAWGYGEAKVGVDVGFTVVDKTNALFTDVTTKDAVDDDSFYEMFDGVNAIGVTLGDYFAKDDTIAIAGEGVVAVHQHNPSRNTYLYLPLSKDNVASATDNAWTLLQVAINEVFSTKKTVTAASTPTFAEDYGNMETTVSIACATSGAEIYYTLDGTEPSSASTPYTEPFTLTEAKTIKAIAYADGYTVSEIGSLTTTIKAQAAQPVITVTDNGGTATVAISSETEGSTVYYNFSGSDVTTESVKYSEPITVSDPVTVTAFAVADGYIDSELASQLVKPSTATVRYDILTKFDANRIDYSNPYDETGSAKATYLFSWGKTAKSMYDTTQPGTTVIVYDTDGVTPLKNQEGNDSTVTTYPEIAAETLAGNDGEWIVESQGQIISWENTTPKFNIGDGSNYNPAEITDVITANDTIGITSYFINLGGKVSGEPYNARLRTAKAYTGPFDIVAYVGQGNGSNAPAVEIQTSTDAQTWTKLADANVPGTRRLWGRTKVSYEGTDAVYVRLAHVDGGSKAMIYNVYLLNAGEHTQEWTTGIVNVESKSETSENATISSVYSINGAKQSGLRKGINIVRYSDGSVRKVMVK